MCVPVVACRDDIDPEVKRTDIRAGLTSELPRLAFCGVSTLTVLPCWIAEDRHEEPFSLKAFGNNIKTFREEIEPVSLRR